MATTIVVEEEVKISELPAAGTLNATDQFEINQGGVSRRATFAQLQTTLTPVVPSRSVSSGALVTMSLSDGEVVIQTGVPTQVYLPANAPFGKVCRVSDGLGVSGDPILVGAAAGGRINGATGNLVM